MARTKQILLDNAWTAWGNAIRYCDLILKGLSTLENRKNFVSSLHNAVELFLKQIMLNENDHRIADIKNLKDAQCELAKRFYNSENLNEFFSKLEDGDSENFQSIKYSRFYALHKELLKKYLDKGESFKAQLKMLGALRNDETHFYIREATYLSENQFESLHNFMISFYWALQKYHLFPFLGKRSAIMIGHPRYEYLMFDRKKLKNFSYRNAVKNAPLVQTIAKYAHGMELEEYLYTAHDIAEIVFEVLEEQEKVEFKDVLDYVSVMYSMKMIRITDAGKRWEDNPYAVPFDDEEEMYIYRANAQEVIEVNFYRLEIDLDK